MEAARTAASNCLARGGDRLEAVRAAISVLEDDPSCNAGRGSNLTESGCVENDASIMDQNGAFGAVGAAPGVSKSLTRIKDQHANITTDWLRLTSLLTVGIRNPIWVAHQLAVESQQPMPLGRVRPMLLAGDGVRRWALSRALAAAPSLEEAKQVCFPIP
jgi:taspase, threonine aspartase, 1